MVGIFKEEIYSLGNLSWKNKAVHGMAGALLIISKPLM